MVASEDYLRTQQVARGLGVSVSTIKRWVDSGAIQATRTLGKHRLIARHEAEQFAKKHGLKLDLSGRDQSSDRESEGYESQDSGVVEFKPSFAVSDTSALVDDLVAALRRGRGSEVRELILSTYASAGPVALADSLVQPAMQRLGHDWEVNGIDVFQEHRATRLVKLSLFELVQRATEASETQAPGPLALGASPEGDPYTLPGLLCEIALRWVGWDVMNLGVNLPMGSLSKAVHAHRPRLVWVSISYLKDQSSFIEQYRSFFEVANSHGTAVILGGQALTAELRAQLVATSLGERMSHLVEFARLLARSERSSARLADQD